MVVVVRFLFVCRCEVFTMTFTVSAISEVTVSSVLLKVESVLQLLILPIVSLYTMFHGFDDIVALQYCSHDCIFAFLKVASYFPFSCKYWFFLVSLKLLSCKVRWYRLLMALIFFLIMVISSVYQGTDLNPIVFCSSCLSLNDFLLAASIEF